MASVEPTNTANAAAARPETPERIARAPGRFPSPPAAPRAGRAHSNAKKTSFSTGTTNSSTHHPDIRADRNRASVSITPT